MKTTTRLLIVSIFILLGIGILAQAPNSFNYQAVLRDASGLVKANTSVSIEILMLQGSSTGTEIFTETHTATTNAFGLINLEIGTVNTTDFATINWAAGPYFIKIVVDGTEMGTSQLLSVPYALHAKTVETEQQTLALDGSILTLSGGGGSVTIPTGAGADNWGTQTVVTDASLSGNGTTATPLKIGQNSAASGQVLKWDGTTWAPADDETGGGGSPTGAAGGDLSGNYPDPTIGDGKITTAKIADGSVTSAKIYDGTIVTADLADNTVTSAKINNNTITADDLATSSVTTDEILNATITADDIASNAVTTDKINASAVTGAKISQMSATNGQALKWNGTTWAPANDGLYLPYIDTLKTSGDAFKIYTTEGGAAITGRALSTSASTEGVKGVTYSSIGYGVWGISYSPEGQTIGVYGRVSSTSGRAVYGYAESSTGTTYGIYGTSSSADGFGVYGTAKTYGVYGKATSTSDSTYGVYGFNSAATGMNYGTYGLAKSTSGRGVYGVATSSSGATCGVKGHSFSSTGYGVYGGASKYGVYGKADSVGITTYGVTGESVSETGYGVYGNATSTTGINYGMRGRSSSASGFGVHGIAPNTGVKGEATSTTGLAYGVYGQTASSNGYGVYGSSIFVGTTGRASGEDGIGVSGIAGNIDGTGVLGQAVFTGGVGVYGIGNNYDFYAGGSGTNYGPFTGAHEVKLGEGFPTTCETGLIVTATGKAFARMDDNGKISISSTLPEVALSSKINDKAVFGVIVKESPLIKNHWFKEGGRFAIVNALGEGRVWVCNASGNIEAGDYITTSDAPGYGQKQADDVLHTYTVGKATETVDWNKVTTTITVNGKTYKVYLIAVVYTCG